MELKTIDVRKTYRKLFEETLMVFSDIRDDLFHSRTILPTWRINNIISHLAANALLKTSDINSMATRKETMDIDFDTLAKIINANNEKWVSLLNDLEKNTLIDFYGFAYGRMLSQFDEIEDLNSPAVHDVKWYDDATSPWWLDIAREYTELWMHSAQICNSLNIGFPFENEYAALFYKICLHALNRLFRRKEEVFLKICIGNKNYTFSNRKGFIAGEETLKIDSCVYMKDETAWKLFSGIQLAPVEIASVRIEGNKEIGERFLEIESVMVKAT